MRDSSVPIASEGQAPTALWQGNQPAESIRLPVTLGQYELTEALGRGGMGAVFRATHLKLKRPVAVKILSPHRTQDSQSVARFQLEMEAIGRLDDPHIVRALDAADSSGLPFLVMELVEGIDLAKLLRIVGGLPVADAAELTRQAALGLQYVHVNGLVHRDIKPSNLMLSNKGVVKLLDLGLARIALEESGDEPLTATGDLMGTADFMAPEQGLDSHGVDIRADIYSLGCTLYMLLSGRAPFSGPEYDSKYKKLLGHSQRPVPTIREFRSDLPNGLESILMRMLEKLPGDRYQQPVEVAEALHAFAEGHNVVGLAAGLKSRLASEPANVKPVVHSHQVETQVPPVAGAATVAVGSRRTDADGTMATTQPPLAAGRGKRIRVGLAIGFAVALVTSLTMVGSRSSWFGAEGPVNDRPAQPDVATAAPESPPPERKSHLLSGTPGQVFDLFEQPPAVLEWPEQSATSQWHFSSEQGLLVNCTGTGLLQLGVVPAGTECIIEVTLQQIDWTGGMGLFFGYEGPDGSHDGIVRYQHVSLASKPRPNGEQAYYVEWLAVVDSGKSGPSSQVALAARPVARPALGDHRLAITLGKRGLQKVAWDGEELAGFLQIEIPPNITLSASGGALGVMNEHSSGTYRTATLIFSGDTPDEHP